MWRGYNILRQKQIGFCNHVLLFDYRMKPTNDDVVTGTVAVADVHHSKPSAPFQVATEVETNSNPNESQILFIRIAAMFCLIFGLTEIGLGSYVFDYFTGLRAGSWWSAVIVTTSGKPDTYI